MGGRRRGMVVIAIFSTQFVALWTALFAVGNSGLALLAMETERRALAVGSMVTSAFLVYLTYVHLHELPKF
jgi:hypothetical protein